MVAGLVVALKFGAQGIGAELSYMQNKSALQMQAFTSSFGPTEKKTK